MTLYGLLRFLAISLFASFSAAAAQIPQSMQATPSTTPQSLKYTGAERKALLAKARQGDENAQLWLGSVYEQGLFGRPNYRDALKWFRRLAAQGNSVAQQELGAMYEDGEGVRQNYAMSAAWYRKAAEHVRDHGGASAGRNDLGLLYLDGHGVPKDYVQAYMWFRLADSETNLNYVKSLITLTQVLEGERMAAKWEADHGGK